ncbi:hypothetical protein BX666DRAFT_2023212 [Dichotomocladium elegans]|nr:hypothetical protein BX666DRAFT_2023212 [Dichotomocladium elegans]
MYSVVRYEQRQEQEQATPEAAAMRRQRQRKSERQSTLGAQSIRDASGRRASDKLHRASYELLISADSEQGLPSPNNNASSPLKNADHPPAPTSMVCLPSSPNSLVTDFSHNNTNAIASQVPTPSIPVDEVSDTIQPRSDHRGQLTSIIIPAKRDCKSHVPSALSRPCKRCVIANKEDSCKDVKHKKRGRPRLHEAKRMSNGKLENSIIFEDSDGQCEIVQIGVLATATDAAQEKLISSPTTISFIHEPIESFRGRNQRRSRKEDATSAAVSDQQDLRDPEPPPSHLLPGSLSNQLVEESTITMFLSMDMCCARASDEVGVLWGYRPQDLVHRSMYGLISPHDKDRLSQLHRLLLDNIRDISCRHDRPLPNTQLSTSPLFYETHPDRLTIAAEGSNIYSDTLHFKKLSGEHELYAMAVYLGGGLGADLNIASTLAQLYIVAEMRKHKYKVSPSEKRVSSFVSSFLPASTSYHPPQSLSSSSPGMVIHASKNRSLNTSRSGSKQSVPRRIFKPIAPYFGGHFGPHQVRQGTLPSHFTTNSQLNTVSLLPKSTVIPRVNIAPSSSPPLLSLPQASAIAPFQKQQKTCERVVDRLMPSQGSGVSGNSSSRRGFSGGLYFRRIAAAPSPRPTTSIGHESNNNAYATLAYRIISPTATATSYTHPTLQYFLETSSSTLNAAASAAQGNANKGESVILTADNDRAVGKTDANRKAEMSIKSLLC